MGEKQRARPRTPTRAIARSCYYIAARFTYEEEGGKREPRRKVGTQSESAKRRGRKRKRQERGTERGERAGRENGERARERERGGGGEEEEEEERRKRERRLMGVIRRIAPRPE